MSRIRLAAVASAVALIAFTVVGTSEVATASPRSLPKTLTLFTGEDERTNVDEGEPGLSDADERFLHGGVKRSLNGPVVGEYYFQGERIRSDGLDGVETFSVQKDYVLPGGQLQVHGIITRSLGSTLKPGQQVHFVIIGGTGIYRGARGELISTVVGEGPFLYRDQFIFTP